MNIKNITLGFYTENLTVRVYTSDKDLQLLHTVKQRHEF